MLPAGKAMCMAALAPTVLGLLASIVINMFPSLNNSGDMVDDEIVTTGPISTISKRSACSKTNKPFIVLLQFVNKIRGNK